MTQLSADRYASLVLEFLATSDVHERYALRSLVQWHVPAPWHSWGTFIHHYPRGNKNT